MLDRLLLPFDFSFISDSKFYSFRTDSTFYDCLPISSYYLYYNRAYLPYDVCEDTVSSPDYFNCKVNYHHV